MKGLPYDGTVNHLVKTLVSTLVVVTLLAALPEFSYADVRVLDTFAATQSDSDTPPVDAQWQTVTANTPESDEYAAARERLWYRIHVDSSEVPKGELWSLFFWRYNLNLKVFFNGVEIGGDVIKPDRYTMGWNHALLVDIQPTNWLEGQNVIHIQHNPSPFGGTFSPFKLGNKQALQEAYEARYFWRMQVPEYLLVFALGIALITFILWVNRPGDTHYLWFLGMCLSWSVFLTHMVIYHNPIPYEYWLRLVHMALSTWIFTLFGFINRHLALRQTLLERFVLLVYLLALTSHIVSGPEQFRLFAYVTHLVNTLAVMFLFALSLRKAVQRFDRTAIALCIAVVAQVLFAFQDFWLFFAAEVDDWERTAHLSHFGVPLLLSVFLYSLINRFNEALTESEQLNRELEDRVAAGKRALEESYAERERLAQQNAAIEERQKIYRELHDDVGSHLISVVHSATDDRVNKLAKQALDSLRSAVYRATYDDESLLEFLANIRDEAKLRLGNAGLKLIWFEDPDLPNAVLNSADAFHLSRLLRELISNTIRHAQADTFSVTIEAVEEEHRPDLKLLVEIADNGIGFNPEDSQTYRGAGLQNIKYRLEQLDAAAAWQTSDQGSQLRFRWSPR